VLAMRPTGPISRCGVAAKLLRSALAQGRTWLCSRAQSAAGGLGTGAVVLLQGAKRSSPKRLLACFSGLQTSSPSALLLRLR